MEINYGELFRLLLKRYGITQAELSKATGISQKQISRYINNEGSQKVEKLNMILVGIQELANDIINPNREYIDNGLPLLNLKLPCSRLECEQRIKEVKDDIEYCDLVTDNDLYSESAIKAQARWYQFEQISEAWEKIPAERLIFWRAMKEQLIELEDRDITFISSYSECNDKRRKRLRRLLDKESLKYDDYDDNLKFQKKLINLTKLCNWQDDIRAQYSFTFMDYMSSLNEFVDYCCEKDKDTLLMLYKFEALSGFSREAWFYLMKYQIWLLNHPDEEKFSLLFI